MQKKSNKDLNRINEEDFKSSEKIPVIVILDNVRSALNVGSIFRSSDAFRVEKLYLCGITAQPPNRDIQKTALGATESVNWEYKSESKSLVNELKAEGVKIWALEQCEGSESLESFTTSSKQKMALLIGHEVNGVDPELIELCDGAIEIPQWGTKHSLNVSVATGILIWHLKAHFYPLGLDS